MEEDDNFDYQAAFENRRALRKQSLQEGWLEQFKRYEQAEQERIEEIQEQRDIANEIAERIENDENRFDTGKIMSFRNHQMAHSFVAQTTIL